MQTTVKASLTSMHHSTHYSTRIVDHNQYYQYGQHLIYPNTRTSTQCHQTVPMCQLRVLCLRWSWIRTQANPLESMFPLTTLISLAEQPCQLLRFARGYTEE
jgi:hypothetical protein